MLPLQIDTVWTLEEKMPGLNVTSEIGNLKRVVVHSPGPEVEAMTPKEAYIDLYNDILPLQAVRKEHDELKGFLKLVSQVYELKDLLAESLASPGSRFEFLTALASLCPIRSLIDELMALHPVDLADLVIEGLPARPSTLAGLLSPRSFALRPLPNAYFMRDSAAVFRDWAISSATAFDVRLIESIVTRFIFTRHPEFRAKGLLIDGPQERNRFISIEGGDILVISPHVLAIGVSERTTPEALELLAQNAGRAFEEEVTVLAVVLPKERATIHLDMTFTVIDRDLALIYAPVISGPSRAEVVRVDVSPKGKSSFRSTDGLLPALGELGFDFDTVLCGDGDSLYEDREQWWSGANSFAFAPGKILMYSCNTKTLEALDREGFEIKNACDFLEASGAGALKVSDYPRLVVGFDGIELARGGGGARCMTLPVERENL
jgi:arginine deiminase